MTWNKNLFFICLFFHPFCLFSYLFYLWKIFFYDLCHHCGHLFFFIFLGFLNVNVSLLISSFIYALITFFHVILFVFVPIIILSILKDLRLGRTFLVSKLILIDLKNYKIQNYLFHSQLWFFFHQFFCDSLLYRQQ